MTARKRPAATEQAVDAATTHHRNLLEMVEAVAPFADRALLASVLGYDDTDLQDASLVFLFEHYLDGARLDAEQDRLEAALQGSGLDFDTWTGEMMTAHYQAGLVFGLAAGMRLRLVDGDLRLARCDLMVKAAGTRAGRIEAAREPVPHHWTCDEKAGAS